MVAFDPSITKRVRHRKLTTGTVEQVRWFVNFNDPQTGQRKLPSLPLVARLRLTAPNS